MGFFRIKRSVDDVIEGHMEAYMTSDGEYGTKEEASIFGSLKAAEKALKNDRFNSTDDYRYDFEDIDDDDDD